MSKPTNKENDMNDQAIHVNVINALVARQLGDVCSCSGLDVESAGGICPCCQHSTMAHENDDRVDGIVADVLTEGLSVAASQDAIAFRLGYSSVIR